ncbi:hypothetical protein LCGC14_2809160 [marine sediment metagenome]|uniref:NapC/NirT cytochrome c N-terminal domain-containing protein n=1 Tax=marine sediment metagenome TaxID=412755 RepID=A0A0F9BBR9_9ZZZZ
MAYCPAEQDTPRRQGRAFSSWMLASGGTGYNVTVMIRSGRIRSLLRLEGLSRGWQIAACLSVGIAIGSALVVARLANAASYLSESPAACINCHVMTDAYVSWQRGSHARVAKCVDCHVPHSNPIAKLAFKSADGAKHSYVFTVRSEPQVLRLSSGAVPVVQANCVRCHANKLQMIRLAGSSERTCWDCHSNVHGHVRAQSASPRALRPKLPDAGSDVMK